MPGQFAQRLFASNLKTLDMQSAKHSHTLDATNYQLSLTKLNFENPQHQRLDAVCDAGGDVDCLVLHLSTGSAIWLALQKHALLSHHPMSSRFSRVNLD